MTKKKCRGSEAAITNLFNIYNLSNLIYLKTFLPFFIQYDTERIGRLSKRLIDGITSKVNNVVRNGDPNATYPGTDKTW